MANIDRAWILEQFDAAKVRVGVGKAVLKLLDQWEKIELAEQAEKDAISIFARVALNQSLVEIPKDEVWGPAQPGFIRVGDEVRVANDAFTNELGRLHNGRRGKVVAIRHGDIIINSTDGKEPRLESTHYSPYKLEKRIR
jgi:hypothetical protein